MAQEQRSSAQPMKTEVFNEIEAFEQLGQEWDSLLDESDQQNFFLRAEWNRLWWIHHAPPGTRLYLITCRNQNGELMGIAPLYWRQHCFLGIPHSRELLFLGMGIALKTSEFTDLIARRGDEQAVATAFASCLHQRKDWDRIWLWQVPRESSMLRHFTNTLGEPTKIETCDRAPYIDTSATWPAYKASLGRSMRRNTEYYSRRLFKHYNCEFNDVSNAQELESAMHALIRLHQARWQSQGEQGVFNNSSVVDFLSASVRHSFPHGRLRLWTLKINGTIEAALLGFLDNGVLHYFQKGFNPAYASEDLGTAMLALCIRASFDDPAIKAFDFMGGGATYKEMWAHSSRETLACQTHKLNARTVAFQLHKCIKSCTACIYRTIAPTKLRLVRAQWLRRKKLRKNDLQLSALVIFTWAFEPTQQATFEFLQTAITYA